MGTINRGITTDQVAPRGVMLEKPGEASGDSQPITSKQLYDALFDEDGTSIKGWIASGRLSESVLNTPHASGDSLLVYLAENPKSSLVRDGTIQALINYLPADQINAKGKGGITPLMAFVKGGQDSRIAQALLERGADPNASDDEKQTVLMHFIKNNGSANVDVVRYLCHHRVRLEDQDNEGNTALHHVAKEQVCDLVPVLVAAGANRNATNDDGKTPLQIAQEIVNDHRDYVHYLSGISTETDNKTDTEIAEDYQTTYLALNARMVKEDERGADTVIYALTVSRASLLAAIGSLVR